MEPTARRRRRQHRHRGRRLRLRRRLPAVPGRRPRDRHRSPPSGPTTQLERRAARLAAPPAVGAPHPDRRRPRAGRPRLARARRRGASTRPSTHNVVFERAAATDARVICVGHTHVPEVRDLGWKVIVNAGSAGYVFDGDPTASWASVTIVEGEVDADDPAHAVRRPDRRQRHLRARPARRRLPRRDGAHGEAGPMSLVLAGQAPARGRDRHGRRHAARQRRRLDLGRACWPAGPASPGSRASTRRGSPSTIAAEIKDFDPSDILDRKDMRRTDRYIQFALVVRPPGARSTPASRRASTTTWRRGRA